MDGDVCAAYHVGRLDDVAEAERGVDAEEALQQWAALLLVRGHGRWHSQGGAVGVLQHVGACPVPGRVTGARPVHGAEKRSRFRARNKQAARLEAMGDH